MNEKQFNELNILLGRAYRKMSIIQLTEISKRIDEAIYARHAHWGTGLEDRVNAKMKATGEALNSLIKATKQNLPDVKSIKFMDEDGKVRTRIK